MSYDYEPHEYQAMGTALLLSSYAACLSLDPGLGKTSIALNAFSHLRDAHDEYKMLVIVPINPMRNTWPREIEKWAQFCHLSYSIIHGTPKERLEAYNREADIYLINPENIEWMFKTCPVREFDVLCVDESTRFKSTRSKRWRTLKRMLPMFERRWIMTGTLVPNGLKDLYGQMYICDQGESLGQSVTRFTDCYFYRTGYGGYTLKPREGALEALAARVEPITLSLSAEDWLEMPEVITVERKVDLNQTIRSYYKKIETEFILQLEEGDIVAANSAVAGAKCRQIANGFIYDEEGATIDLHNAKYQELTSLTEELNGHPLLIFYEFKADHDRIMEMLSGHGAVSLRGVSGPLLDLAIRDFNRGEIPYLIIHAGATYGLNIQESCYHMIWFGLTWNLEHYLQAVGRLYRQGQRSSTVFNYHILARDTLDEKVSRVLCAKEATQDQLLNALKDDYEHSSIQNCV